MLSPPPSTSSSPPPAAQLPPTAQAAVWFYVDDDGERQGPVSIEQLAGMLSQGLLSDDAGVWSKSLGDWRRIKEVPAIVSALG